MKLDSTNIESPARWVFAHARARPHAPAVDGPRVRLGYGALAERMSELAGDLRAAGVAPGHRVVIALPHEPLGAVALLAVQAAGACAVPINRDAGEETLRTALSQTRARHAVICSADAAHWGALAREFGLARLWIGGADRDAIPPGALDGISWTPLAEDGGVEGSARSAEPVAVPPDGEALILYTSGSTGRPRGVIQTFRNIAANTRSIVTYLGLREHDRAMAILPLFYCYGLSVLQTHLSVGGSVFLDPRFAFPRVVVEAMATEGCTGFAGVPLTFEMLRRLPAGDALRSTTLRYLTQAGGAMAPDTIRWAREAFAPARLFVMYGQTSPISHRSARRRSTGRSGSRSLAWSCVSSTRRIASSPPGRSVSSSFAARTSPRATSMRPRRRPPSFAMGPCTPATSATATAMASSSSWDARRRCSRWGVTG
jgi:acyl-CoA synthetase (AMP-forming)/AMP-acid ligase II